MDRKQLEKEVKEQKASDDKEFLTKEIEKAGGLIANEKDLDSVCKMREKEVILILQRQIQFRKSVSRKVATAWWKG